MKQKLDPTQNPLAASLIAIIGAAATFAASEQWIDQGTFQALVQLAGIVIPAVFAAGWFHIKAQTNVADAHYAIAAGHQAVATAARERNDVEATRVEAQKPIVVNVQEAPAAKPSRKAPVKS